MFFFQKNVFFFFFKKKDNYHFLTQNSEFSLYKYKSQFRIFFWELRVDSESSEFRKKNLNCEI